MKVFLRSQPLSAAITLKATTGGVHQEYNATAGEWSPDRFFIPVVIIPDIVLIDPSGIIPPNENGNKYLSEVEWSCNDTIITNKDADIIIDNNVGSENRGKITIRRNCPDDGSPLRFRFRGKIFHSKTKRMTEIMGAISLTCSLYTEPQVKLEGGYSASRFFSILDREPRVSLFARLTQKGNKIPFMRFVYRIKDDTEELVSEGSFNDEEYSVPIDDLTSSNKYIQKYRVKLMDCRKEYNTLVKEGRNEIDIQTAISSVIKVPVEERTQSYDYEVGYKYPPYVAKIVGDCVQENGDIVVQEAGTSITISLQVTTKKGVVPSALLKDYFEVNWGDGVWLDGDATYTISVNADTIIEPIIREKKTLHTRRLNY